MNPNQQFCLRWNNHQSTLISVFEALLESGTLVDCTLAAEGQYLKAHKVVLSACSPYLGMLLSQDFEKHPILILKDVKFAQLKSMLDYMYRGEVNISQDQLGTFLKAAESLQIKGLTDSGGNSNNNNNNNNNSNNSGEEDYNARHRKHLALMAAAAARARSPIIEQQNQHPHQRWMNNGGSMHEMMRDGSISPSPRKRKRIRRPSLGHNPMQNGHDEMPLQPLIQQAQANTTSNNHNNVLAQSLAAPPLTQPPKCITPPRPVTPLVNDNHREEEMSSPSPKPQPMVEHNNNINSIPSFKQEKIVSSPDIKDNGVLNNNNNHHNEHSEDEGGSDTEERSGGEIKKEDAMEDENNEELDEEIEEEMDEENSRSAHAQGATMANAHWLMADASLPNSESFQDSKVEVCEEVQKIKLVQQDKLIATPPSSQQLQTEIKLVQQDKLIATPPSSQQLQTETSATCTITGSIVTSNSAGSALHTSNVEGTTIQTTNVAGSTLKVTNVAGSGLQTTNLSGSALKILTNNNLVQGTQLKSILTTPGHQQFNFLNPLQMSALNSGQTRQIYLTNISRLITINPTNSGGVVTTQVPALILNNQNTTSTIAVGNVGNNVSSNEVLSCNMCGKKYQWKQSLTRHIREHRCAKGPQHSCPCCNLSFKHTSSLNKHVMLCSAVHARLQRVPGEGVPTDDEVQEIKDNDEHGMEDDGESCDNNDAIVDDVEDSDDDPLS